MPKSSCRPILALAAVMALAVPAAAQAEALVVPDSSYQFFFRGSETGWSHANLRFDGIDEGFVITWLNGTQLHFGLHEQEEDLGGGRWAIEISMYANTDLFSVPGETVWVNVGYNSQPLQLSRTVKMDSAVLSFHKADGSLYENDRWDLTSTARSPWDGYLNQGQTYGFTDVGGKGVTRATFHFEVSAVPEPASVPLWLGGSLALLAWRRRAAHRV